MPVYMSLFIQIPISPTTVPTDSKQKINGLFTDFSGVFRNLSNIYDGTPCENNQRLRLRINLEQIVYVKTETFMLYLLRLSVCLVL